MILSINYSPAAASLLQDGKIHIDRFKTPDWPDMIAEASQLRPVAVHFDLRAGSGELHQTDWGQVEKLLTDSGTPHVNLHLDPNHSDFPACPADTTDPHLFEQVYAQTLADVQAAVACFGAQRVVVENSPYHAAERGVLRPAIEPVFIQRILAESGCGLLLDIAHARVTAHTLGMDACQYLDALPVERIRELHFAGVHTLEGRLRDHLSALPADWQTLDWVLGNIKNGSWGSAWMLSFEYGGVGPIFDWRCDPQVIAAQTPMLYQKVKAV